MAKTLVEFLDNHRIYDGDAKATTHTAFGQIKGKFHIDRLELPKLYSLIANESKNEKYKHIGLVERPISNCSFKPLLIDIDCRYNAGDVNDRIITKDDILTFLGQLTIAIDEHIDLKSVKLEPFFVFQRPEGSFDEKDNIFSDGIHITCRTVFEKSVQFQIRDKVIELMNDNNPFTDTTSNNTPNNIYDISVIEKNGWFLHGCGKDSKPLYVYTYEPESGFIDETEKYAQRSKITQANIQYFSQRSETYMQMKNRKIEIEPEPAIVETETKSKTKTRKAKDTEKKAYTKRISHSQFLSVAQSAEFYYLLHHISADRFDDYTSWFEILTILKNSGVSFEMFNHFSSKSDKYEGMEKCFEDWSKYTPKEIENSKTVSSLYNMLKIDNPIEFEYINECINSAIEYQNHKSIAALYTRITKCNPKMQKYIYNGVIDRWYYCGKNSIWTLHETNSYPDELRHDLDDVLHRIFGNKAIYLDNKMFELNSKNTMLMLANPKDAQITVNSTEIKSLTAMKKKIENSIIKIGDDGTVSSTVKYIRKDYTNNKISLNDFNKTYLFAFDNMLFDCNLMKFRSIEPEDRVMKTTDFDYIQDDLVEEQKFIFEKLLIPIFDDEELIDFFLRQTALAINGVQQHFLNFFTGSGRNGKTLLWNFIFSCFGSYGVIVNASVLMKDVSSTSADPEKIGLVGARIALMSEFEQFVKLNSKIAKQLTGGDTLKTRGMYKDCFTFIPQYQLIVLTNVVPGYEDASHGMDLRFIITQLENQFGSVYDPKRKLKIADKVLEVLLKNNPKLKIAMMQILIKTYIKNYTAKDITLKNIPAKITNYTNNFLKENDPIVAWFDNNYVIVDESKGAKVQATEFYNAFIADTIGDDPTFNTKRITQTKFGIQLVNKRKLEKKTIAGRVYYLNIERILDENMLIEKTDANSTKNDS